MIVMIFMVLSVFMDMGLVSGLLFFVHNAFTTLAAAQAAPYPLSMFMMPTPGAQLESMLASAARPPWATP